MKVRISWLLIPVCLCLIGVVAVRPFKGKKPFKKEAAKTVSTTWGNFNQYEKLQLLLKGFSIESMIDLPSKDIETLAHHELGLKRYLGVVPTKEEAKVLREKFGTSTKSFIHSLITVDRLPKADLIFCWDALCSYPTNQLPSILLQFKKSGSKYLLMRHYPEIKKNQKNREGTFEPINWTLPPYGFPEPLIQMIDPRGTLALWSVASLP